MGVAMMSVGDLYATMTHISSVGMFEANPIARHVMAGGSLGLILFKVGSVGLAIGLMLKVRHKLSGELGSWVLLAMMTALTIFWYYYNGYVAHELTNVSYDDARKVMNMINQIEQSGH
jgi:Domain of unknown function (DUF5658)